MTKSCHGCAAQNPAGQTFCGSCGAPLSLQDFIARAVTTQITERTRERDAVEAESAVRIFEKAYGWAKLVGGIATAIIAVLVAGATYESLNLKTSVADAQQTVTNISKTAEKQVGDVAAATSAAVYKESAASLDAIGNATNQANRASKGAEAAAKEQTKALVANAATLRRDFQKQAAAVTTEVATARGQISAASKLQPQMESLQRQLTEAQGVLAAQQKTITSSADFAKKIFASHRQDIFVKKTAPSFMHATLSLTKTADSPDAFADYILLPEAPIMGTLQIMFNQTPAAANSFFVFHNLVVIAVEKYAEDQLFSKVVSFSYFPDPEDATRISKLEVKGDRVFADGDPLPRFLDKNLGLDVQSEWISTPAPKAAP